jgi:transcriptional regulator with XRE-family HTH domain
MDRLSARGLAFGMTGITTEKAALGRRLAEARDLAGLTQPTVALMLRNEGHKVTKQAVSAWEKGRNVPDALVLRQLARLYDASTDALLGLQPHSAQAERLAVVFDSLSLPQREGFLEVCGPFLEKYARGADLFDSVQIDEEISPEQQRVAERNAESMKKRPSVGVNRRNRLA